MRIRRNWWPVALAVLVGATSCGGDENRAGGSPVAEPKPPVIDIVVDANRDGMAHADDPADQEGEDTWSEKAGASFLANLDDDDDDNTRDADDEIINSAADELDLAPILVSAWPEAPEGASGVFTIDALSAESVRIWKKGLDGVWSLALGSVGPCTNTTPCQLVTEVTFSRDEVVAGLQLGIEGRRFRTSDDEGEWTGTVELAYSIHNKDGVTVTSDAVPDGFDRAKIRVAPWMMFGNLSALDTAWSDSYDPNFVAALAEPLEKAGMTYRKIENWQDQWVQDYFQTAWTSIPGPNGTVQGMRVANARPWGQSATALPIKWLRKSFLGPDRAVIEIYNKPNTGTTYDSHGNHDLLPPYTNGAESYPQGRIIHGSGVLKETKEFYAAQKVQGPPLVVKTSWLYVGHVDEVFSYVPAKTPRGWKLIVGSPRLAKEMLEKAVADGLGETQMFVGKTWDTGKNAAISINAVLADQDLMLTSQTAQTEIDDMVAEVQGAVGLTDDEIVYVPYLFEGETEGLVAYNPGTANLLAFGDYIVQADPFGPVIDGVDLFKKDLQDRLGTPVNQLGSTGEGLHVYFADDWDLYHVLLGEVHCGSNVDGPPPAGEKWWETAR